MTIRLSTGARNGLTGSLGFEAMFNRGYINIYTGTQPATADSAVTGTLLGTITNSSLALTKETRATGSVTITAATGGTINNITVGGLNIIPDGAITALVGDAAGTASLLCDAINRNGIMQATVSGAVVTLMGRPGTGVTTAAVAGSLTTVTATYVAMGSGVAGVAPVNGLILASPSVGVVSKSSSQVWSFSGLAAGTAGWFRLFSSDTADTGAILTAAPWYPRLDGSVATSGGDMALSNIAVTIGAPNTCDRFNITMPAQ